MRRHDSLFEKGLPCVRAISQRMSITTPRNTTIVPPIPSLLPGAMASTTKPMPNQHIGIRIEYKNSLGLSSCLFVSSSIVSPEKTKHQVPPQYSNRASQAGESYPDSRGAVRHTHSVPLSTSSSIPSRFRRFWQTKRHRSRSARSSRRS